MPFTSVQIVEQMDAPPTCTIAFPASSKAIKVLAGTVVHLFGEVRMREGLSSFSPKEVLLFEGEVSGISYNKNADQRQVSLSCESIFHK
ncbi:MAG: hypothetical protein H8E12_14770 [Rhodobacteraceae bacterium]|nr:hypothetical protein [Paracoccaceae bacterium]